jgi:hypothetical protein
VLTDDAVVEYSRVGKLPLMRSSSCLHAFDPGIDQLFGLGVVLLTIPGLYSEHGYLEFLRTWDSTSAIYSTRVYKNEL